MENDLIFGTETSDSDMLTGSAAGDGVQIAAAPSGGEAFADALVLPLDAAQVVIPEGENIVRVPVTPGEVVELPFPSDAQFLAREDNGNLAIKVGDVTVILQGYVDAAGQTPPVIEASNGQPLDIATILASTDPNIDIQTAAGPAASPQGQGADNTGAILTQFGEGGGLGGFTGAGAQDGTDGPGNGPVDQTGTLFRLFGILTPEQAPTAQDDSLKTDEDTPISGQVVAIDPQGDPLTYAAVGGLPAGVTFGADGKWSFDPTAFKEYQELDDGDTKTISFQYNASDGTNTSNTATVTIEVDGLNDAPVAPDYAVKTDEDTKIDGQVVATDVDKNDTLTYSVVGGLPAGVTFDAATGKWAFDPTAITDYQELDDGDTKQISFQYKASDGTTDSVGTVTIDVDGVNDAPVAPDYTIKTDEDTPINGTVVATDADKNDTLTYSLVGALPAGVTFDAATGKWAFDPTGIKDYQELNDGDTKQISFQYKASDGTTDSVGTVTIDVDGVNDNPVFKGGQIGNFPPRGEDDADTSQTLNWHITDIDDTQFTITVDPNTLPPGVTYDAVNGKLIWKTAGHYDYLADGETESFVIKFTITDAHGGSIEQDYTLTMVGKADAADAVADTILTNVGANAAVLFPEWAVLANDKDASTADVNTIFGPLVGGNSASFSSGGGGTNGQFGFSDDATVGTGSFNYQDKDGSTAKLTIQNQQGGDLTGTTAHEIIVSGGAGDKIDGHGGKDVIFGGGGDDTVIFHNGDVVNGGDDSIAKSNGFATSANRGDVLVVDHDVNFVNTSLTTHSGGSSGGIETISTTDADGGAGKQTVVLGASEVNTLSDHTITGVFAEERAIKIDGDAVDQLYLSISKDPAAGGGWVDTGQDVNGYHVFAHETTAGNSATADAYVMVQAANVANVHLNQDPT